MTKAKTRAFVVAAAVGTTALILAVLVLTDHVMPGARRDAADLRPLVLLISLVVFNSITYIVWMNRWNIVAHVALAFSMIAYVIPIVFLHQLDDLSSQALDLYYQVMAAGLLFAVLGVLVGAMLSKLLDTDRLKERTDFESPVIQATVRRRVMLLGALGVAGVFLAFGLMGFIPAFTADPLVAKFFRGQYAAAYAPVAPLYRGATSVLSVLLPLLFLYAVSLRKGRAAVIAVSAVTALLLGLIRDPAASGVLLLIGVYVAVRRKPWVLYFAILVGTYFVGGALYYFLTLFGVEGYGIVAAGGNDLLAQVAAGAPDIKDQIAFLNAWLRAPQYTYGATWIGGLFPGNNPWNPSVWSLRIVNPTQDIATIASGGLRLPPPIWGLVSFGWPGVVFVSFTTGLIQGFLAGLAKRLLPSASLEVTAYWLVLYTAVADVFPAFFRFSYLTVLQLILLVLVFRWRTVPKRQRGAMSAAQPRPYRRERDATSSVRASPARPTAAATADGSAGRSDPGA
ncbi:hypothetical protein [Microbacterium sp. SD291]|uniref:hypothetical protein n=1 Tax=Microbacterium sp. SD291 TaxID=2782007 RepID=UPI001A95A8F9|nr:hypothetical protein [Microbacterium sp. SD291]MBO0981001.1 hypothetical protein [Microbacterium sp. SD291]